MQFISTKIYIYLLMQQQLVLTDMHISMPVAPPLWHNALQELVYPIVGGLLFKQWDGVRQGPKAICFVQVFFYVSKLRNFYLRRPTLPEFCCGICLMQDEQDSLNCYFDTTRREIDQFPTFGLCHMQLINVLCKFLKTNFPNIHIYIRFYKIRY